MISKLYIDNILHSICHWNFNLIHHVEAEKRVFQFLYFAMHFKWGEFKHYFDCEIIFMKTIGKEASIPEFFENGVDEWKIVQIQDLGSFSCQHWYQSELRYFSKIEPPSLRKVICMVSFDCSVFSWKYFMFSLFHDSKDFTNLKNFLTPHPGPSFQWGGGG